MTNTKHDAVEKYRKKPVLVEAIQYRVDNIKEIEKFVGKELRVAWSSPTFPNLFIPTLEGDMVAQKGDWIIRGIEGEFYPCKPGIFKATYERGFPMPKPTGVRGILDIVAKKSEANKPVDLCHRRDLLDYAEAEILALIPEDGLRDFLITYKELSCIDECYLERLATAIHVEIVRRMKGEGER
jgi:hypothetical protein